jgi:membrane protease YdiL (CAAX protease family)
MPEEARDASLPRRPVRSAFVVLAATTGFALEQAVGFGPRVPDVYDFLLSGPLEVLLIVVLAGAIATPRREVLRLRLPPRAAVRPLLRAIPLLVCWYVLLALACETLLPPPSWLTEVFSRLEPHDAPQALAFVAGLVVGAPLAEELFLRGLCLSVLTVDVGSPAAIVGSAVLFGVLHVVPAKIISVTAFGLALAYVAWSTRSIVPGLVAHGSANGLALLLGSSVGEADIQLTRTGALLLAGCVFALSYPLWRLLRRVHSAAGHSSGYAASEMEHV